MSTSNVLGLDVAAGERIRNRELGLKSGMFGGAACTTCKALRMAFHHG